MRMLCSGVHQHSWSNRSCNTYLYLRSLHVHGPRWRLHTLGLVHARGVDGYRYGLNHYGLTGVSATNWEYNIPFFQLKKLKTNYPLTLLHYMKSLISFTLVPLVPMYSNINNHTSWVKSEFYIGCIINNFWHLWLILFFTHL